MLQKKEQMREHRRQNDEESIKRQEAIKMNTINYEYERKQQLRANELAMEKEQKELL